MIFRRWRRTINEPVDFSLDLRALAGMRAGLVLGLGIYGRQSLKALAARCGCNYGRARAAAAELQRAGWVNRVNRTAWELTPWARAALAQALQGQPPGNEALPSSLARVLAASRLLFGEAVVCPAGAVVDERRLLGLLAEAYDRRAVLARPARAVFRRLESGAWPQGDYLCNPAAYLPGDFWAVAGVQPPVDGGWGVWASAPPEAPQRAEEERLARLDGLYRRSGRYARAQAARAAAVDEEAGGRTRSPGENAHSHGVSGAGAQSPPVNRSRIAPPVGAEPTICAAGSGELPLSAQQAWERLHALLRAEMTKAAFERYLAGAWCEDHFNEAGGLRVYVPEAMQAAWLNARLRTLCERFLRGICGADVPIEFVQAAAQGASVTV